MAICPDRNVNCYSNDRVSLGSSKKHSHSLQVSCKIMKRVCACLMVDGEQRVYDHANIDQILVCPYDVV